MLDYEYWGYRQKGLTASPSRPQTRPRCRRLRGGKCPKGQCKDGAMGAVVGEILLDGRNPLTVDRKETLDKTRIIVGTIAALTNHDVNVTANIAETAVRNNALNPAQALEW